MTISKEKYLEFIFVIIFFIFAFSWAIIQPFNVSPDELMRYQIPNFIFNNGYLPHGGDESIRNNIWGTSYAFTPILSYIISAFFMKITSFFSSNSFVLLMSARFVSILCSTFTVFISIKIAHELFDGLYKWIFIIFVGSLPQFIFISSYVNTDALAIFSTALIVYAWILGLKSNWNKKSCILLAISISICSLSYYNAYGFILSSILLFTASTLFMSRNKFTINELNYKPFLKKAIFISIIVLCLVLWWFIRNYILYDGDILGLKTCNEYGELYAMDQYKPSKILTPQRRGFSLIQMLINMGWIRTTYISFIGVFGYMELPIYIWMYIVYTILFAIGFIGVLIIFKDLFFRSKNVDKKLLFNIFMVVSLIIPNILNMYYSYTSDFEPQGRYSLPMLIPFMYFLTLGIQSFLNKFIKNKNFKHALEYIIPITCIVIAVLCFTNIMIPKYTN